jgi:hypothetical protein
MVAMMLFRDPSRQEARDRCEVTCAQSNAQQTMPVVHTKHGVKASSANLYDVSDESFSCGEERRLVHLHLD